LLYTNLISSSDTDVLQKLNSLPTICFSVEISFQFKTSLNKCSASQNYQYLFLSDSYQYSGLQCEHLLHRFPKSQTA